MRAVVASSRVVTLARSASSRSRFQPNRAAIASRISGKRAPRLLRIVTDRKTTEDDVVRMPDEPVVQEGLQAGPLVVAARERLFEKLRRRGDPPAEAPHHRVDRL